MTVAVEGERNLLEVIRKAKVDLPTFCYHSELSIYGACRLCLVEVEGARRLLPACTTEAQEGMVVRTHTEKLVKYRKMILELLLSERNHIYAVCVANGTCELRAVTLDQAQKLMDRLAGTPEPPTGTPEPPTETPSETTGARVAIPDDYFVPGDQFSLTVSVCNAEQQPLTGYPLFIILETAGLYFFGPSFTEELDCYLELYPSFSPGWTRISVVPPMIWPDAGHGGAICYAALTNPEVTALFGELDSWSFTW